MEMLRADICNNIYIYIQYIYIYLAGGLEYIYTFKIDAVSQSV